MIRLLLFAFLICFAQLSFGQMRLTTESGNKVLLYWKYEDSTHIVNEKVAVVALPPVANTITIDSTKVITTDFEELFYLPSSTLVKYFGEKGARIRCKLSCSNKSGIVQVHFMWEIPVADGNKYYGLIKEGNSVTFEMVDGKSLALTMGQENDFKSITKHNFSTLSGTTIPLTGEQITILTSQPFRKLTVEWKKNSEEYNLGRSDYFVETLPEIY
jgi:hypothetical protein